MTESQSQPALQGFQKAYLRGLGQRLPVRVHVGKKGLGEALEREIDQFLNREELVKIRFGASGQPDDLPVELAKRTGAALAGTVGKTALLYRPGPEPAERKIRLPEKG